MITEWPGSTCKPPSFPSGPSLGATFDVEVWAQVGQTIGHEARGLNNQAMPVNPPEGGEVGAVPGLSPGKSGIVSTPSTQLIFRSLFEDCLCVAVLP